MAPEQAELADLLCRVEFKLVEELNVKLCEAGLGQIDRVSDAVYTLGDKYACAAEKEELRAVLLGVFGALTGSADVARDAVASWSEVMRWRRRRMASAPPLLGMPPLLIDEGMLGRLAGRVTSAEAFAPVRGAAQLLIAAAERVLSEQRRMDGMREL
ncbi:hypothetical protein HYH02_010246 [Chlamydomonas schloesseri]|uniref:Uncharacterized protein n=1 Tax=Chlamydomonas schloesseri TaxID=2026947 RepID=A0A835W4V5_9CHLO|nr:hypothetical protein HYH02_010246 [Chlamydomonas schloesseri]|eukprot:KAG2440667.1 hypothetical protein HYH02_010246 [Chlamydomonas schloesseri]